MPTHAELVERYSHAEIEELQTVVASQDYTDEAREIARSQLVARGIAGPPMRGAGFVVPERAPAPAPKQGSPSGVIALIKVAIGATITLNGLALLGRSIIDLALGGGLADVQLAFAGVALCALGAMVFAPRVWIRWAGVAAVVLAYLPLLVEESDTAPWIRLLRWAPVAIVTITTLSMLRTDREKSDATDRATA